MFTPKIKIPESLYEKLKELADSKGYSSVDEVAMHILEEAVKGHEEALSEEEVKERLRGLSYLE